MPNTGSFPPPSRPEQRYDAVVARGERLRRRERNRRVLATSGVAAVAVLAIGIGVLATRGGASDVDPVASTTTTTTSTTAPVSEVLVVTASVEDDTIAVDVDDSSVPTGDLTLACVHVRLQPEGPAQMAVATGSACWYPTDGDGVIDAPLLPSNGVDVGCSVSVAHPDDAAPPPTGTGPLNRSFRFTLPADLPTGSYIAEVTGVTGIGDGCPPSNVGELEESTNAKVSIEIS